MAGLGAEPRREAGDRVVVLPGLAVDDLDALELLEQRRAASRRRPRRARPPPTSSSGSGAPASPTSCGMPRARRDADDARRPRIGRRVDHRPCHTGGRFSANAFGPSLASSVRKIAPESFDSFSNGDRSSLPSRLEDRRRRGRVGAVGRRPARSSRTAARNCFVRSSSKYRPCERALLRRLHRERRVRDDPRCAYSRAASSSSSRGNDRVQQTHLERALGRNEVGAQEEFHRLRPRDLARQAHGRAAAREQPALGFHDRELRLRARDADVAAPEHLHAARGAEPVHGRDDGLVQRPVAQHGAGAVVEAVAVDLGEALLRDLGLELGDLGDVLLQVGAREERLADAGDDRDPRLVVGGEPFPCFAEQLEVLHVARVARLGPIDRDDDDVLGVGS